MNFLGHIVLSGPTDDALLTGNFMGDFVKGSHWKALPTSVANGVLLHRHIDSFTDQHEASFELRRLLHPVCGKYAPVALDLLYDHVLACDLGHYQAVALEAFASESYRRLERQQHLMPERCQVMLAYMIEQDWLTTYRTFDGIEMAMQRMERRIGRSVGFDKIGEVFAAERGRFFEGFHRIFPELQRSCSNKLVSFAGQGQR